MVNFEGQEVKGQGHTRPKIWRRGGGIILDFLGRVAFLILPDLATDLITN